MSKGIKTKIVPRLRFPEFKDSGAWKDEPLGDLQFQTGFPFDSEGFNDMGRGIRLIRNRDLRSDDNIIFYSKSFDGKYIVDNGDILVGMDGDFTPYIWNKGKALLNQRVGRVLTKGKNNLRFYYYYLTIHLKKIEETTARTTVKHLSHSDVEKIRELLPSPIEQEKIADCLSSLDDLIDAESQKLGKLKMHKKGLMQQLFPSEGEVVPKLRFVEFKDAGKWEEKAFDQLFTIGSGKDYKHLSKGDIPVYGSGGYMLSVDEYLYDGESVCIGRKGTIDKPMFLTGKFWTVDTLFYTHSFRDCLPKFIYLIFQNINWRSYNEAGGVPSLSKTIIGAIEIFIPKPNEQQKIADCISSIDDLIDEQAQKIEKLKVHKKGLMQRLFPNINDIDNG